jgi:membrane-associated phospholipid phosphatase
LKNKIAIGTGLVTASLVGGIPTALGVFNGFDEAVIRMVVMKAGRTPDMLIAFARGLSNIGDAAPRPMFMIGVIALLAVQRRWRGAAIYLAAVPLVVVAYSIMKELVARPRPALKAPLEFAGGLAYPSGHAASAMVIMLLAALLIGRGALGKILVLLALIGAGLIGLSRLWLGVHWPTDVLGGWMLGGGAALIAAALAQRNELPVSKGAVDES